jgi:phage terminase small subunit
MKTMNEQLTLQQQHFCNEYLVSFNAFKAAVKAGYSESTARKCELLHLPKVQAYLQEAMKRTSERLEITHDMILRELAAVAFASMGDYYDENGVLKPINQLTADQKAALSHYQLIDCVGDYGERAGELSKIKLHNKMAALDKIARHTGFYLVGKLKHEAAIKLAAQQAAVPENLTEGELQEHSLQTSASGAGSNGISIVGEDTDDGMSVDVTGENVLTLSTPVGMEDGRGKMEDGADKNVLTLSPPAKVEPKKGKWSPVSAASIVCATVSCR